MKRRIHALLILPMIFGCASTFGQTKTAKTYLDLMVNIVSTNLNYGSDNSSVAGYKKSNNGIQAGVSFQAGITPAFSLVPELYFMRKGGKLKSGNPLTGSESTLHLNTIELPVLARFHFGKFYINAGPSVAYTFSGNRKTADLSTKLSFENAVEGFKRFDASVQVGGGVEFPFKQKRIALDIRYCYGVTNIAYDKEIYNRALMISIHFSKAWKTNPLAIK
jgi:hypothetical protein